MFIPTLLSTFFRLLLRRSSLLPSKGSLAIYIVTYLPALFLSRYLERMGTSRRDPTTGALISPGEDLNQPGVTEWCFDILYVTCKLVATLTSRLEHIVCAGACQIGSGAFGDWFWWFYLVVSVRSSYKVIRYRCAFTRSPCMRGTSCGVASLDRCSVGRVRVLLKGTARRKRRAKGKRNYENAQNGGIHVSVLCGSSHPCSCFDPTILLLDTFLESAEQI